MWERFWLEAPNFFNYYNAVFFLEAAGRTLGMTLMGCTIGFVVGLMIAVLRQSRTPWLIPLKLLAIAYVETFRRIPFLVIVFIVLYAIQPLFPDASLFSIATIAICLVATAFLSEIVRAGLESVPTQQLDGAKTLNFGPFRTLWYVVLPQAWRVILPPAIAFGVMFIKDTSLASHIGVVELTFSGKMFVNRGFSPLLGFGAVLVLYFLMSYPLSLLGTYLEKRLAPTRRT
ncbi:MAG: polar amino acid transport system permease protein [Glaciecola sp.]|jgi:polar amino acid transport system permease protein